MNVFLKKQNLRLPLAQSKHGFMVSWQKIAAGVVGLVLLIAALNIFQAPIKNTFYYFTAPISQTLWGAGDNVYGVFAPFVKVQALNQENSNLKQENQNLLTRVFSLQQTVAQDQAIQQVAAATQHDSFSLAAAGVIGLDSTGDTMLIDEGSDDGIAANMPVISADKVLYGKVMKVYKNFSQVMLISNKNSVVDAQVLSVQDTQPQPVADPTAPPAPPAPPIYGAVKGSGNLSLYLDLVPSDAAIAAGNTLETSAQEGVFPKGLLIGKITAVDKNDLKPFQTANVQALFDVQNASNVFVITNYKK